MMGKQRRRPWSAARQVSLRCGLAFVAALSACGPTAGGGGTVTPGGNNAVPDGPDPDGRDEGNNIGDLKARLDRLRTKQAEMASESEASFGVCEDLCSLASSICSVKEKLCDIADQHPGEEEYQGLCRKAELECGEAEDSCVACVEARDAAEAEKSSAP